MYIFLFLIMLNVCMSAVGMEDEKEKRRSRAFSLTLTGKEKTDLHKEIEKEDKSKKSFFKFWKFKKKQKSEQNQKEHAQVSLKKYEKEEVTQVLLSPIVYSSETDRALYIVKTFNAMVLEYMMHRESSDFPTVIQSTKSTIEQFGEAADKADDLTEVVRELIPILILYKKSKAILRKIIKNKERKEKIDVDRKGSDGKTLLELIKEGNCRQLSDFFEHLSKKEIVIVDDNQEKQETTVSWDEIEKLKKEVQ